MTRKDGGGIAALDVCALSHSYGAKRALADVSFAIPSARFTVLLGLNGAGKTTLFSLITRLYSTQSGSIRIFGHDIGRRSGAALRRLGIVFQARTLDFDLSVAQNLAYHASLHGIPALEREERMARALRSVAMDGHGRDKVRQLSGGQMRRIEIARSLMHSPRLLLLDEATVGLDIRSRADILAHIRRLVAEEGMTVLWATHLIDEVDDGDHVVVLYEGRLVADGTVASITAETGAATIGEAFAHLTQAGPPANGAERAS
ncbi:ABC transporter ATP-binding protein [Mesorhizobium xinjiangense]|uniref:ABC transporter ATP-binding protein n=1 Tax=Mesorhizobium xinjiangense TaxID=2678685 RepID=UPI0012EE9B79|nr:ABC transporter ATP-binding protein [Mesorhizobium xinjiangense]